MGTGLEKGAASLLPLSCRNGNLFVILGVREVMPTEVDFGGDEGQG